MSAYTRSCLYFYFYIYVYIKCCKCCVLDFNVCLGLVGKKEEHPKRATLDSEAVPPRGRDGEVVPLEVSLR